MVPIWIFINFVASYALYLPSPLDAHGWALRVRFVNALPSYLPFESVGDREMEVFLINRSGATRSYLPLLLAGAKRDLKVFLRNESGTSPSHFHSSFRGGLPTRVLPQLTPDAWHSLRFLPKRAGFDSLAQAGDCGLGASLKTAEGKIEAPTVKFRVIEPAPDDVLESKRVALEGQEALYASEKQMRVHIQQIKVGGRIWLFYRRYDSAENGGGVHVSFRIAELPGKVFDLTVGGAFGDGNPLTITYRATSFAKFTTTHVINSIDGRPWTAEEEKHRQEKLKKLAPVPEKK